MKIFVTGGSGFFGINLIRLLLAEPGVERIVSYDLAPFDYPEGESVGDRLETVIGDIRDYPAVARAMAGCDHVVHAAAALPLYSATDIYSTDVVGTNNVLDAARTTGVERTVHVSSTAVYGIPDHHPLREEDPKRGVGPYGRAKVKAEELCQNARAAGMVVPIVRPKSFIGPERLGVFALFYDWAATGHGFPILGDGCNRYQLLDVEDLAQSVWVLLTATKTEANDTFNVGAARFSTMRRDFQAVLDAAGFGKRIIPIPAGPAVLALRAFEALGVSPLYQWVYETAGKDSFVAVDKITSAVGFVPKYSNQDALLRNFRWYLANRRSFARASGVSHRVPWKQGILRAAKVLF